MKKSLAKPGSFLYNKQRCDMIAMKREVAARKARVFRGANVKLANWRQVTVQIKMSLLVKEREQRAIIIAIRTGECTVTTCRTGNE